MSVLVKNAGFNLEDSTPGTATANEILSGFTAWVNGEKITGNATKGETVVQEKSGVLEHTFTFNKAPKAVLVQFGYNGQVKNFGTFMKISDVEYKQSSGSPGQNVAFGNTSVTVKFLESMSDSYSPYMKVTAIF